MRLAETCDLVVKFDDVVAVNAVNLEVEGAEVIGLLGANGAGKTTLIRTLLGLVRASSGHARLFGRSPSRATRRRVGYVPQTLGLYDDMTVGQNWSFVQSAFNSSATLPENLATWRQHRVGDLSLGTQRQVAFAQALAHEPELLILDEPTSGVSPLGRARLWERIRTSAEAGVGVLVTTHNMEEAEQCDRLLIMDDGKVIAQGTQDEIIASRLVAQVSCDDWRAGATALNSAGFAVQLHGRTLRVPEDVERVRSCLDGAGVVASVELVPANLEEAFVTLVSDTSEHR